MALGHGPISANKMPLCSLPPTILGTQIVHGFTVTIVARITNPLAAILENENRRLLLAVDIDVLPLL
jgi:hypothetical protein